MTLPPYSLQALADGHTFEFDSTGPRGALRKLIQFTPTEVEEVDNLAFGDLDQVTGELVDTVVSANHDPEKVLATVAAAVLVFLDQQPEAWVFATGSSTARTRLYRMGLNRYQPLIAAYLEVYGVRDGDLLPFEPGGVYEAFLVRRRLQ